MARYHTIKYDWLTISDKNKPVDYHVNRWSGIFGDPMDCAGRYLYKKRWSFLGGCDVLYSGRSTTNDMGCCIEFSGKGCSELMANGVDIEAFVFDNVYGKTGCNISRVDVALDFFAETPEEALPFDFMEMCVRNHNEHIVSRCKRHGHGNFRTVWSDGGMTLYIGSPKSPVSLRIYDKIGERKVNAGDRFDDELKAACPNFIPCQWLRFEMTFRQDYAWGFFRDLKAWILDDESKPKDHCNLMHFFYSLLAGKVRFCESVNLKVPSRSPVYSWWSEFIGNVPVYRII